MLKISIILPVLNEAELIVEQLQWLQHYRSLGHEIVLADGGSSDETVRLAKSLVDKLVPCLPGRSIQMNNAAAQASGDLFLFLHADTQLPDEFDQLIESAVSGSDKAWGWFDVRLDNPAMTYRIIAKLMNWRARFSSVCTGDQSLFVSAQLFSLVGGFPPIALMEDVAISKKLRKLAAPTILSEWVITASRRWQERGLIKTVLLMWRLRFLYFIGVSPERLVKHYYDRKNLE